MGPIAARLLDRQGRRFREVFGGLQQPTIQTLVVQIGTGQLLSHPLDRLCAGLHYRLHVRIPATPSLFQHESEAGSGSVHDGEMQTLMDLDNLTSVDQLADFLCGTQTLAFSVLISPATRHEWVQKTLVQFRYATLSRADQGV